MDIGRKSRCRIRRNCRITLRPVCEIMERRQLLSALVVTDTNDDTNPNSLRWAIVQANSSAPGSSPEIDFDIPGTGSLTIHLASPLPPIDCPRDHRRDDAARIPGQSARRDRRLGAGRDRE